MKTAELTGAALDWAVAKCEPNMLDLYYSDDNEPLILEEAPDYHQEWEPSTNWAQGGPIIEREKIELVYKEDEYVREVRDMFWYAWQPHPDPDHNGYEMKGDTPLIAAMRCYVANKLGEDVDIPEELK